MFLLINLVYFFFSGPSDFATPFNWEVPGRIVLLASDPGTRDAAEAAEDGFPLNQAHGLPTNRLGKALVQ